MRFVGIVLMLAVAALPLAGQKVELGALDFLVGKWVGVADAAGTQLGAGSGACSFELELNGKILVRKNSAAYASGVVHDDLMVVYLEDSVTRAIYFDPEEHVIRYRVSAPSAKRAVFESEAGAGPRYRLTYWADGALLRVSFEMAGPGGDYKMYTSGALKHVD